jgi:phosphate-selective porin OprO and OprP
MIRRFMWFFTVGFIVLSWGNFPMANADEVKVSWVEKIEIGYKKGLYIKTVDGGYSLKMQFLIQSQFYNLVTDNVNDVNTFTLRHGQMRLFGNYFDSKLKYRVMFELPGTQGGATSNLRDMWIDWQWKKYFQIKIGQFFVFYDHENLQPTWALQFVDRSIINAHLGFERDLGVDIHGTLFSDRLEYDLFLMNGEGRNQVNPNSKLMTGGRFVANILGKHNYFISDLEGSGDPHLAVGVAAIYDMGNASINNNRLTRVTGDIAFRYLGFSALVLANMAYNSVKSETDYGFLGQMGFFLFPKRLEVAGRWAQIFKNGALRTDTINPQEAGASVNYYFNDHHLKLQAEYSHLWNNAATQGRNDDRVRLQLQLFF